MSSLSSRLSSVQEEILNLYEKNSEFLSDHLKLYKLLREEAAIYYLARQRGLRTINGRTVPSLASATASSKNAIEMWLLLNSLYKSRYSSEKWTLADVSMDRFKAEPENTFKKLGKHVHVLFDNDSENVNEYVCWNRIYYNTGESFEDWEVSKCAVDYNGIYYLDDDGLKVYYISFKDEAEKYSNTGVYTVRYDGFELSADGAVTDREPVESGDSPIRPSAQRSSSPEEGSISTPQLRRRRGARLTTTRHTTRRGSTPKKKKKTTKEDTPDTVLPASPVLPGRVGSSHRLPQTRNLGRLGTLLAEAADPPFLGLKAPANTLKCVRYRINKKYNQYFQYISSTFYIISANGYKKCAQSRMLVYFKSVAEREKFLSVVKFPKSVSLYLGSSLGM
ncbi:E2 [Tadarida brasiliensis papillomavirus 2]|nr:E2 [Tadarida brasiliensis papillomavirus 2]